MRPRISLPYPFDWSPFTTQQGANGGLSVNRMRGADLQRPFHGVRATDVSSVALRAAALQTKLPRWAYFSGVTAAVVMEIPLPSRLESSVVIHVSVPSPRTPPRGKGIIGHCVETAGGDVRNWLGLRISSPVRTWYELAPHLDVPDLVAAGDYLVSGRTNLATVDELRAEVARAPGRRGVVKLRVALDLLDGRSESRRESHLRVIVVTAGLGDVIPNLPIRTSGGYNYRGDLVFREKKVIVEYQSDYHRDPEQFRRDMTRISRLQADGWFVMQVNADDLRNPSELARRIRRVLNSR